MSFSCAPCYWKHTSETQNPHHVTHTFSLSTLLYSHYAWLHPWTHLSLSHLAADTLQRELAQIVLMRPIHIQHKATGHTATHTCMHVGMQGSLYSLTNCSSDRKDNENKVSNLGLMKRQRDERREKERVDVAKERKNKWGNKADQAGAERVDGFHERGKEGMYIIWVSGCLCAPV